MPTWSGSSGEIQFVSVLPHEHHHQLEALLFFNRRQDRVRRGIEVAVERFGLPEIHAVTQGLKVRVKGPAEVQCLFAVETVGRSSRPVGVVLYTRDGFDRITVMHLVVAEEFAAGGSRADSQLLLRLVNAIRRVARTTTGIRHVELLYSAGRARHTQGQALA
jgi:hypothetical protein